MRVMWRWSATVLAAGNGLLLASCSEPTTSSGPLIRPNAPPVATVVGSFSVPVGALQQTINSGDGSVHYCGYSPLTIPVAGTFNFSDCGSTAFDLTNALSEFVPGEPDGWSPPFAGTKWIGPTGIDAPSNEYRARVGSYEYVAPFYMPPGATNVSLQLRTLSDNAAVVYLNGTEIGRNVVMKDCTLEQGLNCNWTLGVDLKINESPATFNLGGANLLRFDIVNPRVGEVFPGETPRSNCGLAITSFGFQGFSSIVLPSFPLHFMTNWNAEGCQNPTGLDFQAKVFYTPATPLFVIGDVEPHAVDDIVNFWGAQWWKNNLMSETTNPPNPSDPGFQSFKGFASSADNFCGGVWSSQPGNSSDPPKTIPQDLAIIVTSKVNKDGNGISGNIKEIVIVHQDGNYKDNPGHAGGGSVTHIFCTSD
jgi:hypothetical protein